MIGLTDSGVVGQCIGTGGGSGYLSLVGAVFMLPFFLFSGYAGHVADVFSKRNVLVVTKAFEIFAMVLGFVAFLTERMDLMLGKDFKGRVTGMYPNALRLYR